MENKVLSVDDVSEGQTVREISGYKLYARIKFMIPGMAATEAGDARTFAREMIAKVQSYESSAAKHKAARTEKYPPGLSGAIIFCYPPIMLIVQVHH